MNDLNLGVQNFITITKTNHIQKLYAASVWDRNYIKAIEISNDNSQMSSIKVSVVVTSQFHSSRHQTKQKTTIRKESIILLESGSFRG